MRYFFRSRRFKIFAGITGALLVIAIVCGAVLKWSSPLSAAAGAVASPVQRFFSSVAGGAGEFFSNVKDGAALRADNEKLQQEINDLTDKLIQFQEMERENAFYKDYLGLKEEHPDFTFQDAMVIGRDGNDPFGSFTIDKGLLQGVALHDPVITAEGLVGYITEASASQSVVTTVLSPALNASAYGPRTKDNGIVSGDGELASRGLTRFGYLSKDANVAVGDYVVSSGAGGIFPAGLLVGTVAEIQQDPMDSSTYAVVKPAAALSTCRDVMVVTGFTGQSGGQ